MPETPTPKIGRGCAIALLGVPLVGLVLALVMIVTGLRDAPAAEADAAAYRADAGCRAFDSTHPTPASQLCHAIDGVVESVLPHSKGRSIGDPDDHIYARLSNGRTEELNLAPDHEASALMTKLYPGEAVRVQYFRGRPVRVLAHSHVARTRSAPDVRLDAARTSPWAGAAVLAVLAILAVFAWRLYRRQYPARD